MAKHSIEANMQPPAEADKNPKSQQEAEKRNQQHVLKQQTTSSALSATYETQINHDNCNDLGLMLDKAH